MKIKLHKHLDRKIWKDGDILRQNVSNMLLSIAWAYIDYVRNEYNFEIKNSDVKDIFIFGSITQLFYEKESDIDLCIVLNLDAAQKQFPNLDIEKMLKLYYYDWAMVHICKIYGRKIDLNLQDAKNPEYKDRYRSGPMFSLINNQWIFKPGALSKKEIKQIEIQAAYIYKKLLNDYNIVKRNGFQLEEIKQFYANIIASKKQMVINSPEQIITPTYMAIRQFRHNGYIKKLHNIALKKETAKYVLK